LIAIKHRIIYIFWSCCGCQLILIDFLGSFCTIEFHNIFFYLDVNKLYIFSSKPFYIICLINFMKKIHFRHLHKSYIKYLRRYVSIKTKWMMKSNLNVIRNNHDYRVKMNVIDYITITCNLKNGRLQITWKNVIDYNDYNYKLRLPHVWQCV
jgi:hypothetical protein